MEHLKSPAEMDFTSSGQCKLTCEGKDLEFFVVRTDQCPILCFKASQELGHIKSVQPYVHLEPTSSPEILDQGGTRQNGADKGYQESGRTNRLSQCNGCCRETSYEETKNLPGPKTSQQGAKVFSKLDASHGYWQVPFDEESQLLTTFNSPFGRYCYTRMPFGIKSVQEIFQKQMHQSFGDLAECQKNTETDQRSQGFIRTEWPDNRADLTEDISAYWNFREELSEADGIILKGEQIVIPVNMQKDILSRVHCRHMGVVKCLQRAKDAVYWPGISKDIGDMIQKCETCLNMHNSNAKEPMTPGPTPNRLWDILATDLFNWDKQDYVLIVNYYSQYVEFSRLEDLSSKSVINHTKSILARHGIPTQTISDNGPQYTSEDL
eukprot:Em0014g624a